MSILYGIEVLRLPYFPEYSRHFSPRKRLMDILLCIVYDKYGKSSFFQLPCKSESEVCIGLAGSRAMSRISSFMAATQLLAARKALFSLIPPSKTKCVFYSGLCCMRENTVILTKLPRVPEVAESWQDGALREFIC